MEAIIIPKDQFLELLSKVDLIHTRVEQISAKPQESFLDNAEFIRLMKISKRTAQTWRDEKVISYSQVGAKLYYKLSDVENLLRQTLRPSDYQNS
jgi:hypothetical protein